MWRYEQAEGRGKLRYMPPSAERTEGEGDRGKTSQGIAKPAKAGSSYYWSWYRLKVAVARRKRAKREEEERRPNRYPRVGKL